MAQLDAHLMSWTDYGVSQGATWAPTDAQQRGWARTHARAVAGTPLNMTFEPTTKAFEFCAAFSASIAAPTEIFASLKYSYPDGRDVSATPNLVVSEDGDVVSVRLANGTADGQRRGCVRIRQRVSEARRTTRRKSL